MGKLKSRPTAVAGAFYPEDPQQLGSWLQQLLSESATEAGSCKAIIVPHAGYIYSGSVAASAYARLLSARKQIRTVVLAGPAHRVGFHGIAVPSVDAFSTPLGKVPLDTAAIQDLLSQPGVIMMDAAHALEHSLEVQLPFLQTVLGNGFRLIPLLAGMTDPDSMASVLQYLWGDEHTLIVVSSDLSHYHDYAKARELDAATSAAIERGDLHILSGERACGYLPVSGLLKVAENHGLHAHTVDLRNSGDTAGSRDRVVGYGAYVFE